MITTSDIAQVPLNMQKLCGVHQYKHQLIDPIPHEHLQFIPVSIISPFVVTLLSHSSHYPTLLYVPAFLFLFEN